jgi:hypothetical protein
MEQLMQYYAGYVKNAKPPSWHARETERQRPCGICLNLMEAR